MKTFLSTWLLLVALSPLFSQSPIKEVAASRTDESIRIDGELNETSWQTAEAATDFITLRPEPGLPAGERSEIKILYKDDGIYVGAMLYDNSPDSILTELTERDDLGNTDFFGVVFEPYQSGLNGFEFIVTPKNVQFDAKISTNGEDENWDAVWSARSQITPDGWVAEMFIPFSALRFPEKAEQQWSFNAFRMVRRKQEQSFWSEIKPEIDGFLNQSGLLSNLQNIKSPFRLQLTPFLTTSGAKSVNPDSEDPVNYGSSFGGGLDLKLGLSDAFTLDMTLIPDFSEARSDDNILNLGPFEQRFDEQRAFFTEGTELFNKGGFFYSRRIGGRIYDANAASANLLDGETITNTPSRAQLVNATKISGRTANGTGVGFFNAIEKRSFATISGVNGATREEEIHPRTNYNVLVVDQNLPNNSSVTLINTNVMREGGATDANVTGLVFDIHNQPNTYAISGTGGLSQRFTEDGNVTGHRASVALGKISGNWQYRLMYNEESDTYNPNDLGLLFSNNERGYAGLVRYNRFEPFLNGYFLSGGAGMWAGHQRRYADNAFVENSFEVWTYAQNKHFWNFNIWTESTIGEEIDYFEPRVAGRYLRISPSTNLGGWMGTDNRKRIRLSANFNIDHFWRDDLRNNFRFNVNARYRASDRFSLRAFVFRGASNGDLGYVNDLGRIVDGPDGSHEVRDVFIGRRDQLVTETGLEGKFSFTANMTLNLRLRHYWARVDYDDYHLLLEDGSLGASDYNDNHNVDFDAFNIDLIYRWRFAPGSDIFFVYKSNITAFDTQTSENYFDNFRDLWRDKPSNESLSLKVIYWLDYASIVK